MFDGILIVKSVECFTPVFGPELWFGFEGLYRGCFFHLVLVSHHAKHQAIGHAHSGLRCASHRQLGGVPNVVVIGIDHRVHAAAVISEYLLGFTGIGEVGSYGKCRFRRHHIAVLKHGATHALALVEIHILALFGCLEGHAGVVGLGIGHIHGSAACKGHHGGAYYGAAAIVGVAYLVAFHLGFLCKHWHCYNQCQCYNYVSLHIVLLLLSCL